MEEELETISLRNTAENSLKKSFTDLYALEKEEGKSRALSLAIAKLEEAMMWLEKDRYSIRPSSQPGASRNQC